MKRLILALILAVVLSLTIATPVFASDLPNGNMPGQSTSQGYWQGLNGAIKHIGSGLGNGNGPIGWIPGIHVSVNHAIENVMDGDLPTNPMHK